MNRAYIGLPWQSGSVDRASRHIYSTYCFLLPYAATGTRTEGRVTSRTLYQLSQPADILTMLVKIVAESSPQRSIFANFWSFLDFLPILQKGFHSENQISKFSKDLLTLAIFSPNFDANSTAIQLIKMVLAKTPIFLRLFVR